MEFDRDIYEFVCNPTSNLETNARSDASYAESRNAGLRSAIGKSKFLFKILTPPLNQIF